MATGRPAKILVVDDNEANRALAQSTLDDEGYTVVLANDGAEGIAAFERERPDCVLLDVRMPGIDGFAACKAMRALPLGEETPILFLTALRDVDTFDRAMLAGGDDFLTKPVRPTELVVRVQTALELRRVKVELREHYELLKNQRDALLRLQLQKERLTTFLVHDLKNPVNAMDLHAQVLMRQRDLPESARASAAQIRAEAKQLTRMILNLLDISKGDEGKLTPAHANVDPAHLVSQIFEELEAAANGHGVTLQTSVETPVIQADPELLRRTLTNLIENAIRYAPRSSAVTVAALTEGAATVFRVADAGTGIPEELRAKVFDPFVQVDAGEQLARGGRGLGLAFCKVAVEAHGGSIWIEDAGPGAVFCVKLPHHA
jgi:signal transduction histidine kinase